MKELWTEKFRPKTVNEYVFTDINARDQIEAFINEGAIPHLLFHGPAGTGKTTLAKILVNELKIDEYDFLQVNASRDNGVDYLRQKIEGFVSTLPFGHLKIVLLDEADYLSPPAQGILRGLMETYQSQARFILTCNFVHKIITPLRSRCQELHIDKTDVTEFTARVAKILLDEGVQFDLDILDSYVKATYPDLRKCLNILQPNSASGVLQTVKESSGSSTDYRFAVVDLLKQRRIKEARQLLCSQARPEEMDEIFRWAYNNLDLWSSTDQGQDQAIMIIRKSIVNHAMMSEPEINLSAMLVELTGIDK